MSMASVKVLCSVLFDGEMGSGALSAGAAPRRGVLLKTAGCERVVLCSPMPWVQTSSTCKFTWVHFIMSFHPAMWRGSERPRGWKTVWSYCAAIPDC